MYRVQKVVTISAGHFLTSVPMAHPCKNPHGHNYRIEVELQSDTLDEAGMVLDFGIISQIVKWYDHKGMLNDLYPFNLPSKLSPTAENLASAIKDLLTQEIQALTRPTTDEYKGPGRKVQVTKVRVWETDNAWAEVY